MQSNFDHALKLVLAAEGGNDDDPHDPGGRTSRGITQREYDAYRRREGLPRGDVWRATDAEVKQIYHDSYWQPWCDRFPAGLDYLYFDMAVNAGPMRATRLLQRALGVKADGHIGVVTLGAIEHETDMPALIRAYSQQRANFYRSLRTFRYFGRGWMTRVATSERHALQMAV